MTYLRIRYFILLALLCSFHILLSAGTFTIGELRTNDLDNPLGIDTPAPRFSWRMSSKERGQTQKAYRVLIASSRANVENGLGDIFDSKRVESSASSQILFNNLRLVSKSDYFWRVQVWDQDNASHWSDVASFGVAMLSDQDWTAQWIMAKKTDSSVEVSLGEPVLARYVRLHVTEIGIPVDEEGKFRVQLSEIEVYGPMNDRINLAASCAVTMTEQETGYIPLWQASNLTDGFRYSTTKSAGATSVASTSGKLLRPVYITIDLGSEMMVDRVRLYARTDVSSKEDKTKVGNFPKDYRLETKTTREKDFTMRKRVASQPTPLLPASGENEQMPMFGTSFKIVKEVLSAKVYACGLGLFEMKINGKKATKNVLEPGESTYNKTVLYATYDITDLLQQGNNSVVTRMGNGFYNNPYTPTRYQVFSVAPYGPTRFLAQLEITYRDGSKEVINTNEGWKTIPSAITASLWHGGEDYDARLEPTHINEPDYDFSGWNDSEICTDPIGKLKAQFYQPTTVVETFNPIRVTSPAPGVYLVDFGRCYAGQYEFTMKAPAGTRMLLKRSDRLDEKGRVLQYSDEYYQGVRRSVYESYLFRGDPEGETWGPRFVYHGLRYLEITGLSTAPTPEQFTAKLIRMGTDRVGQFETSNELLNQISLITERSIEANMYNSLTDCPHIEKLSWLEVPNLMYNSISPIYNLAAWMPKISMDITDCQRSNGMVHTFCPDWGKTYGGEFGDDPTWAASAIMIPWQTYKTYGSIQFLKDQYPTMTNLMNYYISRSSGNLLKYGLGDWGAYDKTTSRDYVVSCTYYQVATVMAQIAELLDLPADVTKYRTLAQDIKEALQKNYYKSAEKSYDSGSQAANAIALYYGIAPEADRESILQNLRNSVLSEGYHLTTGEVGLKPLFLALAQNGSNDVVYEMAMQKEIPSYGYFIEQGCTTLPEFWDMYRSQMHCMMGHIEGWFYEHLAGIRNKSVAYKEFVIEPYFTRELNYVNASTESTYGKIVSSWKRNGDGGITATIEVPCNSTSTFVVPAEAVQDITESGMPVAVGDGVLSVTASDRKVFIALASGRYTFTFPQPATLSFIRINDLIMQAEAVIQSNTVSGWETLQSSLQEAKSLLKNSSSLTQHQLDDASKKIDDAIEALVLKNIALKKTVFYSSSIENYGWMGYKLVDGDTSSSTGFSSSAFKTNTTQWVGVDLGRAYVFNTVKLYPRNFSESAFPVDFEIQVSDDKETWRSVYTAKGYPAPSPVNAVQSFGFESEEARYVRIYATKLPSLASDNHNFYLQLIEMEIERK